MAEIITGLIALPALYLIGNVCCRQGMRMRRTLRGAASGKAAPTEAEPLPDCGQYDLALATASAIEHELARRPEMSQAERLSTLTFTILNAIRQVESQRPGRLNAEPSVN